MDWSKILSERQQQLEPGMIGELLKIAAESKDIISLGPGEPDFDSPDYIIRAAKKALDNGETHYSPIGGRTDLKEELIKKLKRENRIKANYENITVGCGSTDTIMQNLMCLADPGEEILVPDPGFLAYIPSVQMLNAYPVSVPLLQENDFEFTAEGIRKQIKDSRKVKAMIINTPGNPTGTVLSKKSLEEIAEVAVDNDIMIISDEAYERFVYDDAKHISIASLNGMQDHVVTHFSFSKTQAMPGFRVGYAVGPEPIISAMTQLHTFTSLTAPTVSQVAAAASLKNRTEYEKSVERMRKSYDKRRKLIIGRLNDIDGFEVNNPKGAFYVFAKQDFGMDSVKFARWMLKHGKVAIMPGNEFGRYGEGFMRFSYATDYEKIEEAMERIEKAVKKLR